LHGPNLKVRKQPRELIDGGLLEKRIANLLAKEWLGTAKIVLTTYETVRDYEFSLAKQDFFLMICDEAQKIKAPNALVTTACKKQKSDFRIACTGTPVENSLADLWCLFDFIQPGLLGALDTFSKSYRRPIEVHQSGDQDAAKALNVLRTTIAPQVRRTMKQDIAKDLPRKIIVSNARYNHLGRDREQLTIPMSAKQLQMYADGLNKIKSASEIDDSSERARVTFGLLHYIKTLCADPYAIATEGASPDRYGSPEHIQDSPKTAWLIETLRSISVKSEKAIIFTETIKIQQILVSVIHRHFGLSPSVINGDTDNRQDVIDRFQDVDGFNVLILSPLAAGFGVNIVAANHVIHYTRTWNPAKEGQATDRAYRIGQQRDVFVYCPTIVGRDFVSFEQKLDMLMSEKSDLAGDMLDGIGEQISFQSLLPSDGPHGAKVAASRPIDMGVVDSLDGHSFEHFCQLYFASQGFDSIVTPKSPGDGGVDVVAIKNSKGLLVQCKHTGSEEIGWDAIKEIYAGAAAYRAKYPGIEFELVAITNRYYNGSARGQALTLGVRLVQRNDLASILSKLSISTSQLDEVLIRTGFIR
jgi:HJR/Mrr/RecB family endonuclease